MSINTASGVRFESEPSLPPGSLFRRPGPVILGNPSFNCSNSSCVPTHGNCLSELRSTGVDNPKVNRSGVRFACCIPAFGRCWGDYPQILLVVLQLPVTAYGVPECEVTAIHVWATSVRGSKSVLPFWIGIAAIQIAGRRIDRDILTYIRSGSMSTSRGRRSSTSVSAVASTNPLVPVSPTLSSPSECSRLITGVRFSFFRLLF